MLESTQNIRIYKTYTYTACLTRVFCAIYLLALFNGKPRLLYGEEDEHENTPGVFTLAEMLRLDASRRRCRHTALCLITIVENGLMAFSVVVVCPPLSRALDSPPPTENDLQNAAQQQQYIYFKRARSRSGFVLHASLPRL